MRRVVLAALAVIAIGAGALQAQPASAAGGSLSLTVTAVTRESSTAYAHVVADASVSGLSKEQCTSGAPCYLELQAQTDDGDLAYLNYSLVPSGSTSYANHFDVTISVRKIMKIRANLTQGGIQTFGAWTTVSDPRPAPIVTVTQANISRGTSDRFLEYDVTVSASNYELPDAPCPPSNSHYCRVFVEGIDRDGVAHTLPWSQTGSWGAFVYQDPPAYPTVTRITGRIDMTKIVSVRARLSGSGGEVVSPLVAVSDPYGTPRITIEKGAKTSRLSNGDLAYDVTVVVTDYELPESTCPLSNLSTGCDLVLFVQGRDNQKRWLRSPQGNSYQSIGAAAPSYPTVVRFTGSMPMPKFTKLGARLVGFGPPLEKIVDRRDGSPQVGGGSAADKGCQCSAKDPVNTASGEFYLPAADLTLPGAGPTVSLERTYSSSSSVGGPFGIGWTPSFGPRLDLSSRDDDASGHPDLVRVVQENGAATEFGEAGAGIYPADPWVKAGLTRDPTAGTWTFVRDHRETFVFDSSGRLTSERDPHGIAVALAYDSSGQVTRVSGTGGRVITLTWSGGRVASAADSAGRSVTYAYNAAGDLVSVKGVDGSTWSYGYDSGHRMTTLTRPGGGVTTNVYDSAGRVATQTDPLNRTSSFAYGDFSTTITDPDGTKRIDEYSQGTVTKVTTAAGTPLEQTRSYEYDESLNRVASTDPLGNVTRSTFDTDGNPLTTTDPLGRTTTRSFNALGQPLSVKDPAGRTTSMTYNAAGDLLSTTTPGSHTTSFVYNADGTLSSTTDPAGKVTNVTYTAAGLPLCTTDPDSRKRCVGYNAAGVVTSATDAAGKITAMTVDAAGRTLTSKDPLNRTTSFAYDADGNRTKVTDPLNRVTTSAFDVAGQLTSVTDPASKTTRYGYDSQGRRTTVTDPLGHAVTTAYDALGRTTGVTDALKRTTSYTYDGADRPLTTTVPSGAVTATGYDAAGQVTSTTDALGKVTSYAYDAAGRLSSTKDPLGRVTTQSYTPDGQVDTVTLPNKATVKSTWDAVGRQATHVNADGKTTSYSYDPAGLVTKKVEPGALTTSYSYDAAGRLATQTRPDGTVVTSVYDAAGQLTKSDHPGTADDVTYTYAADGARATMVDRTGTTSYVYGTTGLPTKVTNGAGTALGYGYDAAGRLTSITYPGSKQVAYAYDDADQMTKVTDWANRATAFAWTSNGMLASQTSPNGVVDTRAYDAADQLTQIADKKGTSQLAAFGYGYDAAGQLTSATINGQARSYAYDSLGQLGATSAGTYAASSAGLLTTLASGATQSYNAAQQLTAQTPKSGAATSFGYDANGARVTSTVAASGSVPAQRTSYSYDSSGDLVSVIAPGGTVTYAADGDGLRQSRTVGGSTAKLVWNTVSALPLLLDDGSAAYVYGPGGTPVEQVATGSGAVSYLHVDNLGSVRAVTDAGGAVIGTADYDAFGRRTTTGAVTAIGYTGNLTDPVTGLVYLRARDYDPATGQFLRVDPLVDQTRQPYAYTGNNPLDATDPTGFRACLAEFQAYLFSEDCKTPAGGAGSGASARQQCAADIESVELELLYAKGRSDTPEEWRGFNDWYRSVYAPRARASTPLIAVAAGASFSFDEGGANRPESSFEAESRSWGNITSGKSITNIETSTTHIEVAESLSSSGWKSSVRAPNRILYEKDGAKYLLRAEAASYDGWTLEYTPAWKTGKPTIKIRLGAE